LYNVSRQVFGSVGIAVAATELTAGITRYHALLAERAGTANPNAVSWLQSTTAALMSRTGADLQSARLQALKLLDVIVTRQAAVLSYNRVFVLVSLLFIIALPLVFLLKRGHAVEGELVAE